MTGRRCRIPSSYVCCACSQQCQCGMRSWRRQAYYYCSAEKPLPISCVQPFLTPRRHACCVCLCAALLTE